MTESDRRYLEDLIAQVRLFMRDYPNVNRLLTGEESSNRAIAWALQDACNDWNATPPLLGSVDVIGHPAPHMLIRKAAASLLMSVSFLQSRNFLSYSDGRVQVNLAPKGPEYRQIAAQLKADYDQEKRELKRALNIEGGWGGGLHSELAYSGSYTDWYREIA